MNIQTAKVKNGAIYLPTKFRKIWGKAKVFVFPSKDTLVIKKVQEPISKLSDIAKRVLVPRMSQREIEEELQAYRKNR